jgi:BetI-type transcriptional repressor, C-terminal
MPKAAVHDLAEGMLALMYGLWLRFALDPPGLDAARAIRITMDIVRARLGVKDGVPSSPSQRSARALGFKAVSRSA